MKKTMISVLLGLACVSAYADEAEAPIAAYKDNPKQLDSEAAEMRAEQIELSQPLVVEDATLEAVDPVTGEVVDAETVAVETSSGKVLESETVATDLAPSGEAEQVTEEVTTQ